MSGVHWAGWSSRLVWWCILATFLRLGSSVQRTVPLSFSCEFGFEACCVSALAGASLALLDANSKNDVLVPELAKTTQDLQLSLDFVLDATAKTSLVDSLHSMVDGASGPPVAMIGSFYSSRVQTVSHACKALGISQVAWCSSPIFDKNPEYSNVFRIPIVDSKAMLSIHSFLQVKNISQVAVVYNSADAWSAGLLSSLQTACQSQQRGHMCSVFAHDMPILPAQNAVDSLVQTLEAAGVTAVVVAVAYASDVDATLRAAYERYMAGRDTRASGYVWLVPWVPGTMPKAEALEGALLVGRLNHGIRSGKVASFEKHWKDSVPTLRLPHVPGKWLSHDLSMEPGRCSFLASNAYESVALVRLALERVDFSKPSRPSHGPISGSWWGTELMRELQVPGVSMQGLVDGPVLRKAARLGAPWEESTATFKLLNFVDGALPVVYDAKPGGLQKETDYSTGRLAGGVALDSQAQVGQFRQTVCNGARSDYCRRDRSYGNCQLGRRLPGFMTGGWCACDPGYVGRFCEHGAKLHLPPVAPVPVQISLKVHRFSGLSNNGDAFNMELKIHMSWTDPRFPWDAGEYTGVPASELTAELWRPKLVMTGATQTLLDYSMSARRDTKAEEKGSRYLDVNLTEVLTVSLTQPFEPDFRAFPFDGHELAVDISWDTTVMQVTLSGQLETSHELPGSWNQQWPPDESKDDWAFVESTNGDTGLHISVAVRRAKTIVLFRLVIPMSILCIMSWSGFWIAPGALMPRFASGFISFLALQGFKTYAVKLMPNDGAINGMSWIDVYISIVGMMMAFAVAESIAIQFVCENVSRTVAHELDKDARIVFPLCYITIVVTMCLPIATDWTNFLAHGILVAYAIGYAGHSSWQARYWTVLYLRRNISHNLTGAQRHRDHVFTHNELQVFFETLEVHQQGDGDGFVKIDTIIGWFIRANHHLQAHEDELRELMMKVLGEEEFPFPVFEKKFGSLITQVTLVLYDDKHAGVNPHVTQVANDAPLQGKTDRPSADLDSLAVLMEGESPDGTRLSVNDHNTEKDVRVVMPDCHPPNKTKLFF